MYNCATAKGKGLKPWIEKHSMLKHIRREDYSDYREIVDLYHPSAFEFEKRKND